MITPPRTLVAFVGTLALALAGCKTTGAAAPQVTKAAPTGTLNITSTADNTTITVDGQPAGNGHQGPYVAGSHTVHAQADGYAPVDQTVTVTENAETPVAFTLKKLPGAVVVNVNVNADCDIAGDHHSVTPDQPVTFSASAGLVQVTCKAPGYRESSTLVGVKAGRTVTQAMRLTANVRVDSTSSLEFVWMPGGFAFVGCAANDPACVSKDSAKPEVGKTVNVRSFWIGKTEVTEDAYRKCVAAGSCEIPKSKPGCNYKESHHEKYPINCVTHDQATEFCNWLGGRLPTVDEWEYAARSGRNQIYPWGNQTLSGSLANYCDKTCHRRMKDKDKDKAPGEKVASSRDDPQDPSIKKPEDQSDSYLNTAPVGSFPSGATPEGLLDMAGNVLEWTSSEAPTGPDADKKTSSFNMAIGGSFSDEPLDLRVSAAKALDPKYRGDNIGMRCILP